MNSPGFPLPKLELKDYKIMKYVALRRLLWGSNFIRVLLISFKITYLRSRSVLYHIGSSPSFNAKKRTYYSKTWYFLHANFYISIEQFF